MNFEDIPKGTLNLLMSKSNVGKTHFDDHWKMKNAPREDVSDIVVEPSSTLCSIRTHITPGLPFLMYPMFGYAFDGGMFWSMRLYKEKWRIPMSFAMLQNSS